MIWVANVSIIQSRSDWHSSVFSEGADKKMMCLKGNDKGDEHKQTIINGNEDEAMKKLIAMENYKKACKHDARQEEGFVNPI